MIKKENLEEFIYQINTLIKQSEFYSSYTKSIVEGKNDFKLSQVYTKKNYSTDWIDQIEDCINALDTIVRNPRKFIVIEEDIVDVSLARSISVESVKHLAQHTNLISSVKKDGTVIPSKILNTSKEESFEIYENRFIYTLLLKTRDFLDRRFDSIKNALMQSGELEVELQSEFYLEGHKFEYKLENSANIPFDEVVKAKSKSGQLTSVERLTRIKSIISDFLNSAFAKEMRSSAPVRPPIQRTNVILKDTNFKKALVLWQFIESNENMDFKVETSKETSELPPTLGEKYRSMILLNSVLLQSIAASREDGETLEESKQKEKELADEYVTKNIDDFVPDDFPQLKMDLSEIRRIYYRIPGEKTLHLTEISKMNAAIDRVLRQQKINKLKEESLLRKRLIEQQIKEEAEAKRLALLEAQELEKAKKLEEEMRVREQQRIAEEQIEAEKRAEQQRIEAEKQEELLRQQQFEKEMAEAFDALVINTEEEYMQRVADERYKAEQRLREKAQAAAAKLREEREAYWAQQKELGIRLLIEQNDIYLVKRQQLELEKLKKEEAVRLQTIRRMEELLHTATILEHNVNIERLLEDARTFRAPEDIMAIRLDAEDNNVLFTRTDSSARLKIIRDQLATLKARKQKQRVTQQDNTPPRNNQ